MNQESLKSQFPGASILTFLDECSFVELQFGKGLFASIEGKGKKFHTIIRFTGIGTLGGQKSSYLSNVKVNSFDEACSHIKDFLTELKAAIATTLGE